MNKRTALHGSTAAQGMRRRQCADGDARLPSQTSGSQAPTPLDNFAGNKGMHVVVAGEGGVAHALSHNIDAWLRGSQPSVQLNLAGC
jgi:hypothetical protein